MSGFSVTRALEGDDSPWQELRCRSHIRKRPDLKTCAEFCHGMGKLLCRYTTDCIDGGGRIEVKCNICNAMYIIPK